MLHLARYTNEEILPYIGLGQPPRNLSTGDDIFKIKMSSTRLECLKRSQTCVWCRRKGTVWILEVSRQRPSRVLLNCFLGENCPWCALHRKQAPAGMETPHLNLYHQGRKGVLVLMTQDHILPRSRGGSSKQENLQTMCSQCNQHKGNSLPEDFDSHGHRLYTPPDNDTSYRAPEVVDARSCAAE